MAHLTDMEELLSKVITRDISDYMNEAMSCYMAGAYRACIVLSYIALFDDLLLKLCELSKVNSKAKTIYSNATAKKDDQQVFESYLIDQLKSNNLIPALDAVFLDTLRTLRNKAAHPSGHHASAEEARFIYFEVINRFLSKPILSTTQLVDEIISRLENANFFPSICITDTAEIVIKECNRLHLDAFPYLVNKLLESTISDNSNISKNARFFLNGLAVNANDSILDNIVKIAFEKKADDHRYIITLISLLSSNGKLITKLDLVTLNRIRKIISKQIDDTKYTAEQTKFSHPACMFASILEDVGEDIFLELLTTEYIEFLNKFPYSNFFTRKLCDYKKAGAIYIKYIIEKAGSSDFDTANSFARTISDLDDYIDAFITDKDCLSMILEVVRSADRGAFGSKDMRRTNFHSIPKIRARAINYIDSKPRASKKLIDDKISGRLSLTDFKEEYLTA